MKFNELLNLYSRLYTSESHLIPTGGPNFEDLVASPTSLYQYKLEAESIVFLMRRVLDSLVQLTFLLTNFADFERTKIIAYNEIGKFTHGGIPTTDIERIITGDGQGYEQDATGFLAVLNDLSNSFKHCLMHDESYSMMCHKWPTVISYQAKKNNHNKVIIYHNHNAYHLMMGFQDTVLRILANQRMFVSTAKE